MARWASLIDIRRSQRPVVLLDAGDFCPPPRRPGFAFEEDLFFEGMRRLGYDAAGIGPAEIRYGRERLLERSDEAGFELLATNIMGRDGRKAPGRQWTVVHAGGRRTLFGREGGVRVGLFAVTLPVFIHDADTTARGLYEVIDPRLAAAEAVSRLRAQGCDLIVAISFQGWEKSAALAGEVPGIDIVINGRRSHATAWGERRGETLVVDTGPHRTALAEISVVRRGGAWTATVVDRGFEARGMPDRPDLMKLQEQYERRAKALGIPIE